VSNLLAHFQQTHWGKEELGGHPNPWQGVPLHPLGEWEELGDTP